MSPRRGPYHAPAAATPAWLRRARLKLGLTQAELAQRLGLPRPAITKRELGTVKISPHDRAAVQRLLDKHAKKKT